MAGSSIYLGLNFHPCMVNRLRDFKQHTKQQALSIVGENVTASSMSSGYTADTPCYSRLGALYVVLLQT